MSLVATASRSQTSLTPLRGRRASAFLCKPQPGSPGRRGGDGANKRAAFALRLDLDAQIFNRRHRGPEIPRVTGRERARQSAPFTARSTYYRYSGRQIKFQREAERLLLPDAAPA